MIGSQNDGGGSAAAAAEAQLKKGPWTAAEDAILADYVRKHGEGNWNAVQKNTGLNRCGKSCRLRWANHLRPNLKKGSFSPEEERLIIELHAQLGNKWARMAAQLPGRTDNEIKNYWNTRVKRRQRQGLPLYPPDIHPSYHNHQSHSQSPTPHLPATPSNSFAFQLPANLSHHTGSSPAMHLYHPNQHMPQFHMPFHHPSAAAPQYSANATTIQGHSSPLASPHDNGSYSTLPLLDSASNAAAGSGSNYYYLTTPPSIQMPMRLKRPRCDDGDSSCNLDDNPPVVNPNVATTSYSMNPNFIFSPAITKSSLYTGSEMLPHHHLDPAFHSVSVDQNTLSSRMQDAHFDSGQFVYPLKQEELPSNQLLSQDENPEIAYDSKVHENSAEHNNNNNDDDNQPCASTRGNATGLLEDLLEEAHALASSTESLRREEGYSNDHDEKNVLAESNDAWCPSNSTTDAAASVLKPKEEAAAEHDQFQPARHDLISSKLINGSGWYSTDSGEVSNGQSSNVTDDNLGLEMHHVALLFNVHNTSDHRQSSCSWDNMPGICEDILTT